MPSVGEAVQICNQSDLFPLILLGISGYQFYSFMHYNEIVADKISFDLKEVKKVRKLMITLCGYIHPI